MLQPDQTSQGLAQRLNQLIDKVYLVYLGLLPALATFSLLVHYGHRWPFLIFIGGTAAVAVYLAGTFSYTRLPDRLSLAMFMLFDGPLAVWLAQGGGTDPLAFAIEGYLVDGTAVWLGILFLSLRSTLPTRVQPIASVGFMRLSLATTTSLFWPYVQTEILVSWRTAVPPTTVPCALRFIVTMPPKTSSLDAFLYSLKVTLRCSLSRDDFSRRRFHRSQSCAAVHTVNLPF